MNVDINLVTSIAIGVFFGQIIFRLFVNILNIAIYKVNRSSKKGVPDKGMTQDEWIKQKVNIVGENTGTGS